MSLLISSGLDIALDLALEGARVIYVCEHYKEIPPVLSTAGNHGRGVKQVYHSHGDRRIVMHSGGVIYVWSPGELKHRARGMSVDAAFAPPLVWNDAGLADDLRLCVAASNFWPAVGRGVLYSTLQRLD